MAFVVGQWISHVNADTPRFDPGSILLFGVLVIAMLAVSCVGAYRAVADLMPSELVRET